MTTINYIEATVNAQPYSRERIDVTLILTTTKNVIVNEGIRLDSICKFPITEIIGPSEINCGDFSDNKIKRDLRIQCKTFNLEEGEQFENTINIGAICDFSNAQAGKYTIKYYTPVVPCLTGESDFCNYDHEALTAEHTFSLS